MKLILSRSSTIQINKLKSRLVEIDKERTNVMNEIHDILAVESIQHDKKIVKLDKHKGFNWAYFKNLIFSPYDYKIRVDLYRDGNRLTKDINDVEIADEAFKNTPIGKKLPK